MEPPGAKAEPKRTKKVAQMTCLSIFDPFWSQNGANTVQNESKIIKKTINNDKK
jgi:hypothetical protein